MNNLNIFKSLPLLSYRKDGVDTFIISCLQKDLLSIILFLRDSSLTQYKLLISISVVDYPERNNRFEVVYELLTLFNNRLRLKIYTNETVSIPSITKVYPCANW